MEKYLEKQIVWSRKTFGPGRRTIGILKHIEKEMDEVIEDSNNFKEWIDIVILTLDGAWRAGATPHEIVSRLYEKQNINFKRRWPDIPAQDQISEHIK